MSRTPESVVGRYYNPLLLNLIEITEPGGALVWRLRQDSVPWFYGTVNPTSTKQLTGDLYLNTTTGTTWQFQSGTWVSITGGGSGGRYAATFTGQTTLVVSGATHNLGTADLIVAIYDSATGTRNGIGYNSLSIDSSTFNVAVTFEQAQSGRIVIIS